MRLERLALSRCVSIDAKMLELISSFGTAAAAIIAAIAIWYSKRDSLVTMRATMLRDFTREFDSKMRARFLVAEHALKRMSTPNSAPLPLSEIPAELWQMMDFFDRVAMYLKRGYVDDQMVFISFYYWMLPYWEFFGSDVARKKIEAPLAMWDEIPVQITRLEQTALYLGLTKEKLNESKTPENIKEFFRDELEECRHAA